MIKIALGITGLAGGLLILSASRADDNPFFARFAGRMAMVVGGVSLLLGIGEILGIIPRL